MGCCLQPSSGLASTKSESPSILPKTKITKDDDLLIRTEQFTHKYESSLESNYRLERMIGHGAFGRVYEATQVGTGVKRAVKVIDREKLDEKQLAVMLSEVNILKTLDHPHILKVLDVFVETTRVGIVSELCTGGELFERIQHTKRLSEKSASTYMQQILSAVAYCHERHIVHRDLKPENLLLESDSPSALVKVIDFGTSSKLAPGGNLTKIMGTPHYIAPEVLSHEYNEKCDVWSCGVLLFVLLSGSLPFTGNNQKEILRKVHGGRYGFDKPAWNLVSDTAKDIVSRMLTVDPSKRPAAKELLQHAWLKQSDRIFVEDRDEEMAMMTSFKNFRSSEKFRQASLQYMASHLVATDQTEELRRKFIEMDEDKSGTLSRKEIVKGFASLGLGEALDVETVMANCDSDRSGEIDYTEFITAAMNWRKALNDKMIEAAFHAFDLDHSGKIDLNELKSVFGSPEDAEDSVWAKIIAETDLDGDGEIDLEEFKFMLTKRLMPMRRKTMS